MIYQSSRKNGLRWRNIPLLAYKEEGTHFKSITRQVLAGEGQGLSSQLRYFEIAPGGHSTLERHQHVHGIVVIQGKGRVLAGKKLFPVKPFDVVHIPPRTWHQFRPTGKEIFGFLCLVNCRRDRPERPDENSVRLMRRDKKVTEFIRV
jgi:quercetin dioxygenase-like cupin family protein